MHQRRDTGGNLTGHVGHAAGLTPEGQEAGVIEHRPFPTLPGCPTHGAEPASRASRPGGSHWRWRELFNTAAADSEVGRRDERRGIRTCALVTNLEGVGKALGAHSISFPHDLVHPSTNTYKTANKRTVQCNRRGALPRGKGPQIALTELLPRPRSAEPSSCSDPLL